jgi:hypothetical protein
MLTMFDALTAILADAAAMPEAAIAMADSIESPFFESFLATNTFAKQKFPRQVGYRVNHPLR